MAYYTHTLEVASCIVRGLNQHTQFPQYCPVAKNRALMNTHGSLSIVLLLKIHLVATTHKHGLGNKGESVTIYGLSTAVFSRD